MFLVVVLIAAALSYGLYDVYSAGQEWQNHAELLEADLELALDTNAVLQDNLEAAESDLDASQADVARLEQSIVDLADVQAQTADQRNQMVVEAATWQELSEIVAETTTELDMCIDLMAGLHNLQVRGWNLAQIGGRVDVDALNRAAAETFALCSDARDRAWIMRNMILEQ